MTQEEILAMFRQEAAGLAAAAPAAHETITQLAQMLAESRGRLSKENFETLVHIGAVLYKAGAEQFSARQDLAGIMKESADQRGKS